MQPKPISLGIYSINLRLEIELEQIELFLQWIGGITVSVGAIVAFAYWLFKLFSDKWLTAKFAERLEDYKHSQQKELENVRFEINKLMDRTVKLHQREFDVLPETWALLVDAHGITNAVISALQNYPDVGRMNEGQLNEFLADSPFENWQIEELKAAEDKNEYYKKARDWKRLREVSETAEKFRMYLLKYGIFILPAIQDKFAQINHLMSDAVLEHQFYLEGELDLNEFKARPKLIDEGGKLISELEKDVRNRLWT